MKIFLIGKKLFFLLIVNLKNYLRSLPKRKSKLQLFLFFTLFLLIWIIIYYSCYSLFSYIRNFDKENGLLLVSKITEFLTILIVLIDFLSTLSVGITYLFSQKEVYFLLSKPISVFNIYFLQLLKIFFSTNLLLYFLGIAVYFPWAQINGFNLVKFFPLFLLVWFLLLFLVTSFTYLLLILVISFFPSRFTYHIIHFFTALVGILLVVVLRLSRPEKLLNPIQQMVLKKYLLSLKLPYEKYLPTHWFLTSLTSVKSFRWGGIINFFLLLLFFFLVLYLISLVFSPWRLFLVKKKSLSQLDKINFRQLTLLKKDLLIWRRNPEELNQTLVVLGTLIIYGFNLVLVPVKYFYQSLLVLAIAFFLSSLILLTVSSRFLLTLFYKEGKNLWLLKTAPFLEEKIIKSKLRYSFLWLGILILVMGGMVFFLLKLPFSLKVINFLLLVNLSFFISYLSVFFAVKLYSKERKANSPSHLLFTAEGLSYMFWGSVAAFYHLLYFYFVLKVISAGNFPLLFLIFLSLISFTFVICNFLEKSAIFKLKNLEVKL